MTTSDSHRQSTSFMSLEHDLIKKLPVGQLSRQVGQRKIMENQDQGADLSYHRLCKSPFRVFTVSDTELR
jgi:hypothetical protein